MNELQQITGARSEQDDWEQHWRQYAQTAALNPAQAMRHRLLLDLWEEYAPDKSANFIDFGSGQGDFAEKFQHRFPSAKLLGLELSASGVAISRRKVPFATFLVADLFSPPPELSKYRCWAGGAVCSEVLEHVDDPVAFLRSARQYLQGDAPLLITVPGGRMSVFDKHIGHRQHFTRARIHDVLVRAGYRVGVIYRAGFPFFNLYRFAVIARGEQLARDAAEGAWAETNPLARMAAALFGFFFKMNLRDSPFGWQIVAVAFAPQRRSQT
jgi:SAM-dependent methyltransferase